MVAIREFMKVRNHKLEIILPNDFNYEDVEVVIMPRENKGWDYWSDEEIQSIGKIGLFSNSFVDDTEDYSQW